MENRNSRQITRRPFAISYDCEGLATTGVGSARMAGTENMGFLLRMSWVEWTLAILPAAYSPIPHSTALIAKCGRLLHFCQAVSARKVRMTRADAKSSDFEIMQRDGRRLQLQFVEADLPGRKRGDDIILPRPNQPDWALDEDHHWRMGRRRAGPRKPLAKIISNKAQKGDIPSRLRSVARLPQYRHLRRMARRDRAGHDRGRAQVRFELPLRVDHLERNAVPRLAKPVSGHSRPDVR